MSKKAAKKMGRPRIPSKCHVCGKDCPSRTEALAHAKKHMSKGKALIMARSIKQSAVVVVHGLDLVVLDSATGKILGWGRTWEEAIANAREGKGL